MEETAIETQRDRDRQKQKEAERLFQVLRVIDHSEIERPYMNRTYSSICNGVCLPVTILIRFERHPPPSLSQGQTDTCCTC